MDSFSIIGSAETIGDILNLEEGDGRSTYV